MDLVLQLLMPEVLLEKADAIVTDMDLRSWCHHSSALFQEDRKVVFQPESALG